MEAAYLSNRWTKDSARQTALRDRSTAGSPLSRGPTDSSPPNSRPRKDCRPIRLVPAPRRNREPARAGVDGFACLFPIKYKDVAGLALAHHAYRNRQGLEICRKLDLPGVRNLALEFVCDFQTAPVHAAARRCRSWSHIRTEVRIIVPIELNVLSHLGRGTTK